MTENVLLLSGRAETDALGKAISALRLEPDGLEQLAQQLEMLTDHCVIYPMETRQLWYWFERQQPCMEAGEMNEVIESHLGLIDERIRLVREVQDLTAEVGRRGGEVPQEVALAAALTDLSAQRGRLAGLLERLNAPFPAFEGPRETAADIRAAFERGEYEDIESIIARVKAGGPICKDAPE